MGEKVGLGLMFVLTGMLIVGISIPLLRRRVKPNALYGLRVPATLADEWVWYEANARSARDLIGVGIAQIGLALVLLLVPGFSADAYALINASALVVGVLIAAVIGWRRANHLAEQRRTH